MVYAFLTNFLWQLFKSTNALQDSCSTLVHLSPNQGSKQGNYHMIVVTEGSRVPTSHDDNAVYSMREYQSILYHETYHVVVCKIPW